MKLRFHNAVKDNNVGEVQALLRDHPDLQVNEGDEHNNWTALHHACFEGRTHVVKLLLAHRSINVNSLASGGFTPFVIGCEYGPVSIVQLLLKDPRVDITLADESKRTPLWWASLYGRNEVIEWLIASGRDLGDLNQKGDWQDGQEYTALEIAQHCQKTEVIPLLKRLLSNPSQTRHDIWVKLGLQDQLAAELFAITVFLCDNLLQFIPPESTASHPTPAPTRFFTIASKLPMELQMILCRRAVGSRKQNIKSTDSEAAFRGLASKILQVPNPAPSQAPRSPGQQRPQSCYIS